MNARDRKRQREEEIKRLFERFLRESKRKHTAQRLKIVRRAFQMPKHFSAEDLYQVMRREKTPVSKATVYRTLKLLVEGGFLEELEIGARQAKFYEPILGREHHDHMICLSCGDIHEFVDPRIEELQDRAAEELGFEVVSHTLKLFGLCKSCRSASGRRI